MWHCHLLKLKELYFHLPRGKWWTEGWEHHFFPREWKYHSFTFNKIPPENNQFEYKGDIFFVKIELKTKNLFKTGFANSFSFSLYFRKARKGVKKIPNLPMIFFRLSKIIFFHIFLNNFRIKIVSLNLNYKTEF